MKVYLYELDSVRNTAAEIELAQNRLFKETVENGNTVVLSLNQLLDGMGFTGALYGDKGEENYQTILKLFQSGLVKVCKFTDPSTKEIIETLAKYWLKNMGKKHFIVSGIELSPERKADMKAVLADKRNKDILDKWDDAGTEKEKADARYVQRVVNLILELDYNVKNIWVDEETKEKRVNFDDLLDFFLENAHSRILLRSEPNVQKALDVLYLASLKITDRNQRQYRSIWYRTLKVEGNGFLDVPAVLNIAKYIIDLCYNVSVESGISGIKLPYDANGLEKEKIRELQSRHVLVTLADYLDPTTTMPTLQLPPWEKTLDLIQEVIPERTDATSKKVKGKVQQQKGKKSRGFKHAFWRHIFKMAKHLVVCLLFSAFLTWACGLCDLVFPGWISFVLSTVVGVVLPIDSWFQIFLRLPVLWWEKVNMETYITRTGVLSRTKVFQVIGKGVYSLSRRGKEQMTNHENPTILQS